MHLTRERGASHELPHKNTACTAWRFRSVVHRSQRPYELAQSVSNFTDDVAKAMTHIESKYLGVRAEVRAPVVEGDKGAIALLVSGGCDAKRLDTIWMQQLVQLGLIAERVRPETETVSSED
jgi:hypothetical protein